MGFEDNNSELGFEDEQIDLDTAEDLSMGTGRTRAQRKKGIKTEEINFAAPRRDRFGRRGDGEEAASGADMLNPDKPTRIAGGFSRREMTPQEVKPLQSENSKFAYLFSDDEEDEDEVSTVQGKGAAVDALSMKGDEADAGNVFQRETRSVIHSQGKPQRRSEPAQTERPARTSQSSGRFSRRGEGTGERSTPSEKPAASRFSRRSSVQEAPAEPVKEEPVLDVIPTMEEMNPPAQETYTEPAVEESASEPETYGQDGSETVYADSQVYGYGNLYGYGQYPPQYSPYPGYPPQNPYMQQTYGQQPYPYQYPPAGYAQPQYIPVGYVFQAGFVPVEMAHGQQRRRKRPSAARSAHRYDQTPELAYNDRPERDVQRVRAIAARSESYTEQPVQEPVPQPQPVQPPVVSERTETVYESQYDRIAAEIPAEPAAVPVVENKQEERTESAVPSRFARRGSAECTVEEAKPEDRPAAASGAAHSRFAARGSSSRGAVPTGADEPASSAPSAPSAPSGGRFNRRG